MGIPGLSSRLWALCLGALFLGVTEAGVTEARAQCITPGFKQATWGMAADQLQKVVPGLREDLDRFEPNVTAYHSFEFPNNGFSEFRLYKGRLFYIRIKITNAKYNDQLMGAMQRCGKPLADESERGSRRLLWQDAETAVAVYVYPYHGEIRAKSLQIAAEWATYRHKEEDVDKFLDQQIQSAFGADGLSVQERERLRGLRQSIEQNQSGPGGPISAPEPIVPAAPPPRPQPRPAQSAPAPVPQAPPPEEAPAPPPPSAPARDKSLDDFLQ